MPFWKSIKNIVRALECYLRRKGRSNGVSYTQWALWCSFFRYKLGLFGFLGKMAPTMIVCKIKDRTQIKHSLTKYSTYADADAIAHCFFFLLYGNEYRSAIATLYTNWSDKWAFTKADAIYRLFCALSPFEAAFMQTALHWKIYHSF